MACCNKNETRNENLEISEGVESCCNILRCMATVKAMLASVSSLVLGIALGALTVALFHWKEKLLCLVFQLDMCPEAREGTIAIICRVFLFAIGFCMFYLIKTSRHAKWEESKKSDAETKDEEDPVAVEKGYVPPNLATILEKSSVTIDDNMDIIEDIV